VFRPTAPNYFNEEGFTVQPYVTRPSRNVCYRQVAATTLLLYRKYACWKVRNPETARTNSKRGCSPRL